MTDARWAGTLLLPLVLAGCALTDGLAEGRPAPPLATDAWVNAERAPDFSDLRGRHVLVEFWSPACPHCRDAIPEIQAVADSYAGAPVDVVTVSLSLDLSQPRQDAAAVRAALDEHGADYPVGLDQSGRSWRDYDFDYLPHAVLVGPDGRVAWSGSLSLHSAHGVVADHVGPPPGTPSAGTVTTVDSAPRGACARCGTEPCACPSQ